MKLFGLMIMSKGSLDRVANSEVANWRKTRFEPLIAERDKTIAARDETIKTLNAQLHEMEKAEKARPVLDAVIEQGGKKRWRYSIRRPDGKIISLPPVRGYAEEAEAQEVVQLLSDAKIRVINHG